MIGPGSSWFSKPTAKGKGKPNLAQEGSEKKKKRKARPLLAASSSIITSAEEARKRGLTRQEWLVKAGKRLADVEAEIRHTEAKLIKLRKLLAEIQEEGARAARKQSTATPHVKAE
ncbi:hypothetical protein [Croceibacterium mercuriale]|uniref:hypothetical protein n=1 Tax=Croceibacterium mercuriale TaxID=1572751 RepID=UPI001269961F|nr:hypothetical protein [Croceibacterium mercuriale]